MDIKLLLNEVIVDIKIVGIEAIYFYCESGKIYKMFHIQSCSEAVYIEDICGDILKHIGHKIVMAEEVSNMSSDEYNSYTWTFYKLATDNGAYTTIRWCGNSNGYYSESVDFLDVTDYDIEDWYDIMKLQDIEDLREIMDNERTIYCSTEFLEDEEFDIEYIGRSVAVDNDIIINHVREKNKDVYELNYYSVYDIDRDDMTIMFDIGIEMCHPKELVPDELYIYKDKGGQ